MTILKEEEKQALEMFIIRLDEFGSFSVDLKRIFLIACLVSDYVLHSTFGGQKTISIPHFAVTHDQHSALHVNV